MKHVSNSDSPELKPVVIPKSGPDYVARHFFFSFPPDQVKKYPILLKIFGEVYGPQALSILKEFGRVPEHHGASKISTPNDLEYFKEDGTRAFYLVSELMGMSEEELAKVGISDWRHFIVEYVYTQRFSEEIPVAEPVAATAEPAKEKP